MGHKSPCFTVGIGRNDSSARYHLSKKETPGDKMTDINLLDAITSPANGKYFTDGTDLAKGRGGVSGLKGGLGIRFDAGK